MADVTQRKALHHTVNQASANRYPGRIHIVHNVNPHLIEKIGEEWWVEKGPGIAHMGTLEHNNNQAHTCKTLGVVTKPMSTASTHAQMNPRNIIHAREVLISYSRPRPAPFIKLACMSREAPCFLASEPVSLSTTAAYPFVFAAWGYDQFTSLYENYLLVLSTATNIA